MGPSLIKPTAILYDLPTAAKLMHTTAEAVKAVCRWGYLDYIRVGDRWLVSPQSIQKLIPKTEQAAYAVKPVTSQSESGAATAVRRGREIASSVALKQETDFLTNK